MAENSIHYFTFRADDNRLALPVEAVLKVIHAVYVTPVPDSPPAVEGVFEFHQKLVPVLNLRQRFGSSNRKTGINDVFILIRLDDGALIAMVADEAEGVLAKGAFEKVSEPEIATISPGYQSVHKRAKVIRDNNGILLVYKPEQLLTEELKSWLDGLIENSETSGPVYE